MAAGQSISEDRGLKIFGCWNVGGGFERKQETVVAEMRRVGVGYLGITETKLKGDGGREIGDCTLLYKGVSEGHARAGVGLVLPSEHRENVKTLEKVNERLLVTHIEEGGQSIAFIVFYGPNNSDMIVKKKPFFEELQNVIDRANEDKIIIVGDFNAEVGKEAEKWDNVIGKEGDDSETHSGTMLLQLCVANDLVILNTFFRHEKGQKFTRFRIQKEREGEGTEEQKSIIDYCVVRRSMLPLVRDTRAYDDTAVISDHRLVTMKMEIEQKSSERGANKPRQHDEIDTQIRYHLLRQQDKQENFQNRVAGILSGNTQQNGANLEETWVRLRDALQEAAKEVCGSSRPCCNRRGASWWTKDVADAVEKKNDAWREYRAKRGDGSRYETYKVARKAAKNAVQMAKKSSWEDFGNKLGSPRTENQKLFFHVLKKVNQDVHCSSQTLRSANGSLLTDRNEIVERWREYFEERFTLTEEPQLQRPEKECGERISRSEMDNSLQRLKDGRSAGRDGITPEMIKYMGERGRAELLRIINMAWEEKKVPEDWKETIVFPFYRNGDKSQCESYGAISLLSTAAKVYARILEERIRDLTEATLNEAQCGYRRNRSKNDHAFVIRQLIELSHLRRTTLHLCHLSLERALGKLPLSVVMETLAGKNVPASVRLAVLSLFEKRINYVRTGNTLSKAFTTGFLMRPQDSLSSYISVLVLDDVFNSYQARTRKSDCRYLPVSETAYFDQVVLLAGTRSELQRKLDVWCERMEEKGLHLRAEDARVMSVPAGGADEKVKIEGDAVPEVPCLSYSGLCIGPDVTAEEFNRRIGDAGRLFNAAKRGIIGNRRVVGLQTKQALFDEEYVERMVRGSATRWKSKSDIDRLKSMEVRYLRYSGIIPEKGYDLRPPPNPKSLERMCRKQRAYYERVTHMEEDRAPRAVWKALKSTRKRPTYSWRNDVGSS